MSFAHFLLIACSAQNDAQNAVHVQEKFKRCKAKSDSSGNLGSDGIGCTNQKIGDSLVRVFAWPFVLRGVNLLALFLKAGFISKRSRIVQLAKKIAVFRVKSAHARVRRGERISDDSCYLLCKYCTSDDLQYSWPFVQSIFAVQFLSLWPVVSNVLRSLHCCRQ